MPRQDKPTVRLWIYPGSRASYKALLSLKVYVDAFQKADAIDFNVNYLFPWKYYKDDTNPNAPQTKNEDCYSLDTYCSIGLVDCKLGCDNSGTTGVNFDGSHR